MTRSLLAIALFGLLAAPPALGADVERVVVPVGDLDLHSAAGRAELKTRVAIAASSLCRRPWMTKAPDSEFAARYNQEIYRACVGRLTDRTIAGIGHQAG
jgi:UrcA family protein